MNNLKRDVRVLLVGERKVGKTSLILSLVSEEFPEEVPAKAEEITIPGDITPENVPTHIVDFSAAEQDEDELKAEIDRASVICVVYSIDDEDTIVKITDYWLPLVRDVLGEEHGTPVILVGNKCDVNDKSCMESILPIMNQYAEVETCVECSAKILKNISEMFYYAQKAVLHPTGPLYLPEERDLTDQCKKALTRIFKICDSDSDGLLNDTELNAFQKRCFNAPLQPSALEEVKTIVRRYTGEGILNDSLTVKGFLFLHTLFIQRGRHETTWAVLRRFGYGDNLSLTKDYLYPPLKVPVGCTTELTLKGYDFFRELFDRYDQDKDGYLSPTEMQSLFSICPIMLFGPDVLNSVQTNDKGWISLQGYLAYWTLTTFLDCSKTMEYLAYLGFVISPEENQLSAIQVTRDKKLDLQKRATARNVFLCHVVGPKGSGKTGFLQGFLGTTLEQQSMINRENLNRYTISTVQVYGQEKYLMLHEIDLNDRLASLEWTEVQCDVVCLMYDATNPKSFEYVARIYTKYFAETKTPVLIVSAKSDQESNSLQQDYPIQPAQFCSKYKLPPPQDFSCVSDSLKKDVYVKLATMAAYPYMRRLVHTILFSPSSEMWLAQGLRNLKQMQLSEESLTWLKAGIGMAALAMFSIFIIRAIRSPD